MGQTVAQYKAYILNAFQDVRLVINAFPLYCRNNLSIRMMKMNLAVIE
jgi:hypothetical protein